MDRRTFLIAGASVGLLAMAAAMAAPAAPTVVFLNPGEPVERGTGPQWRMAARFMAVAARNLGMRLEVLYAERDHLLMLRQAEAVARREVVPDYVVMVNEKLAARQMLGMFARSPAKIMVIHNDLTPEQRHAIGNERERFPNWIGTITTDEPRGAYLVTRELCRQLGAEDPRIIAITGDRSTPVSLARASGVEAYVAEAGRGRIHQVVFGDWSYVDGEQKARILLSRYPDTNIIWAANDSMAMGALRVVQAVRAPVLVGGTGGWEDALASIAQGGMSATVGTHFFIGAWAMVLLFDYHNNVDFARHGGVNQTVDLLYVINRDNALKYREAVFQQGDALDFSVFSKALHPRPGNYNFSVPRLLGDGDGD